MGDPGWHYREQNVPPLAYLTGITNALQAVATFTADHDYSLGELISFRVSKPYGMYEINNMVGLVLATTSDTITVDIDTLGFTPFVYPVSGLNTPPVCVPAGSGVIPNVYPRTVNLEDVFDVLRPA